MATSRRCANNHVYDADLYASCPYCSGQSHSIQFGAVTFGEPGKTVAPGMRNPEEMGKTVAPGMTEPLNKTVAPGMKPEEMGKTVPPHSAQSRTVGVFQKQMDRDPVVGWVACIEGPDKGSSYELLARINIIGRGEKADAALTDRMVSKEQAKIGYDAKHNNFYLIPGDSTNTSYLNDVPLYMPTPLSAYDLIEVGESKLIFVPLCGEKFCWNRGE